MLRRAFLGLLALSLSLVGVQAIAEAPAAAAPRVVYYDASRAGEFATNFAQAAQIWNSSVTNVRLQAGSPATVVIYVDSGWPRAYVTGLGSGRIYMGRQAVNQGYNRTRIATHEWGHILGLPDNRTGLCSDLMSGSSAPVSCANATPSAAERARVDALFASRAAPVQASVYVWS
ncbi:snapalysin family zinc-dependent metalloprotease [Phytohabitans suffuscus]|uniref:Extracellular small neutral protease n=1 Tax=Phytohabitans suffuscus TaxID=624315 RepID=A0A6F8YDK1_9ACTN|nr:snapalysin family zinc-dependent metalloprotease [Phytohabitans suffuscus]BCB84195.1 peptidase [Phytohabitans suffuscus]